MLAWPHRLIFFDDLDFLKSAKGEEESGHKSYHRALKKVPFKETELLLQ